jgi:hypothetical protein
MTTDGIEFRNKKSLPEIETWISKIQMKKLVFYAFYSSSSSCCGDDGHKFHLTHGRIPKNTRHD